MTKKGRLQLVFERLKQLKKKAVIFFLTAGDPNLMVTRQTLTFAQRVGADCVELGVPFSDPLADGPVIQASSFRALKKGVHLENIFRLVRGERKRGLKIPLILMSSYNPIYHYGTVRFIKNALRAGIDGLIVPDLPVHEASVLIREAKHRGLDVILMSTPTTTAKRKNQIVRHSRGFIYYVSVAGVTGERNWKSHPFRRDVLRLRRTAHVPVCVGFGISTPREAKRIAHFSDGVIVGSAIVRHLNQHSPNRLSASSKRYLKQFVSQVKSL